nr:hypothetical protein [Amycolatopsis roodepoortensis]
MPDAGYFIPPLTTVDQEFAEVGRRCVHRLLQQIPHQAHGAGPGRARSVLEPKVKRVVFVGVGGGAKVVGGISGCKTTCPLTTLASKCPTCLRRHNRNNP